MCAEAPLCYILYYMPLKFALSLDAWLFKSRIDVKVHVYVRGLVHNIFSWSESRDDGR